MTAASADGADLAQVPGDDSALAGDLDHLATEAPRLGLPDLGEVSASGIVAVFADDHDAVVAAIRAAQGRIAEVIDLVSARMARGGRLIYVGAGTGGRLAALDAAEIGPSYGISGRIVAVFAGGVEALAEGREFYEDDEIAGAAAVAALSPGPDDVVMGVSASGRTPFVLGGVRAGGQHRAATVAFACVSGSVLGAMCDLALEVPTGTEMIAGSTRLKAGSAQKIVLNAISTAAMVRLGRTYRNLMVDLVADNTKLRRRALRAVVQATGVSMHDASVALDAADGHAKVAVVAVLTGLDATRARELLASSDGVVRDAVRLAHARD